MCWSGEASAALATAGFLSTGYAAYKKESRMLWLPLGYFSLMELLQAFTYSVIDQCALPSNQVATLLGYLHICFQPFFANSVALYFIDQRIAKKVAPIAYSFCLLAAVMMLIKLYPFEWASHCQPGVRPMCGEIMCAFHGNWHIAWSVPVRQISDKYSWYFMAAFLMPTLYGSWRWTFYHLMTGPVLARLTTSNLNEWPAVWCLFSIDLLIVITNTRVRNYMHVKSWFLWRLLQQKNSQATIPPNDQEFSGHPVTPSSVPL